MAREYAFVQVDVFTDRVFGGNPLAVILDARGLSDGEMQAIAREMNLSETTFVLPPTTAGADYRVRIFTPRAELPFAGHPTIATAFALREEGRLGERSPVCQECGIGLVPIAIESRADGPFLLVTQGAPRWEEVDVSRARAAALLGCEVDALADGPLEVVSTGVRWLVVPLRELSTVRALAPDLAAVEHLSRALDVAGITVFCRETEDPATAVHLRSFAPLHGVPEDPVCGSGNGSVAAYLVRHGAVDGAELAYVAEQGSEVGRRGRVTVHASRDDAGRWTIRVGGEAVTVLEGELLL
jgi:PhzF family phenazine biosynthesis protein